MLMPACSSGPTSGHAATTTANAEAAASANPAQRKSSMTRNAVKRANADAASTAISQTLFEGWNNSVWTTYAVNTPARVANASAAFETPLSPWERDCDDKQDAADGHHAQEDAAQLERREVVFGSRVSEPQRSRYQQGGKRELIRPFRFRHEEGSQVSGRQMQNRISHGIFKMGKYHKRWLVVEHRIMDADTFDP